jgi:intermediate cleaving peptidase 55
MNELCTNQHCRDGELVLVDAGGEYGGYITDITRTWPVNGKFTDPQRDLYEMILKVQRSVVSLCREDADLSLDKLHRITEDGLRDGLKSLGFNMDGNVSLVTAMF